MYRISIGEDTMERLKKWAWANVGYGDPESIGRKGSGLSAEEAICELLTKAGF